MWGTRVFGFRYAFALPVRSVDSGESRQGAQPGPVCHCPDDGHSQVRTVLWTVGGWLLLFPGHMPVLSWDASAVALPPLTLGSGFCWERC